MRDSVKPVLLALSLFSLLNVMFVPMFDVWGGLFPSHPDDNFFKVFRMLLEDPKYNWHFWVTQITVFVFVPSVFMLIFSLTESRGLLIASTFCGILLWVYIILRFVHQNGASELLKFDDCSVSVGTWIALILFVISFLVALCGKKETTADAEPAAAISGAQPVPAAVETGAQTPEAVHFCTNCGAKIQNAGFFCEQCGHRF